VKAELARARLALAHLSRYSWVLWTMLLMAMALSLSAGIKWEW
jgi:hypothetical protein